MDEPPASMQERLVRLELTSTYERERTDYLIAGLSHRLLVLETTRQAAPSGSTLKYTIAILLPLGVLLATGDLKAAVRALRLALGSPT